MYPDDNPGVLMPSQGCVLVCVKADQTGRVGGVSFNHNILTVQRPCGIYLVNMNSPALNDTPNYFIGEDIPFRVG